MTYSTTCPVCDKGTLTECKEPNVFKDNITVDMLFSICDTCGVTITNMDQSRRNKRAYMMAKHGGYDFL